jgi:hypothetical protein
MWYMCNLSYLPLALNFELAKDGQLFKNVKFSPEQPQRPRGSAKVFIFFFNVGAGDG